MNTDNRKAITKKIPIFIGLVLVPLIGIISKFNLLDVAYLTGLLLYFTKYIFLKKT